MLREQMINFLQARVWRPARQLWRDLSRDWSGSYRPELYYMRGPGPKWREKHAYARVLASRPHQN